MRIVCQRKKAKQKHRNSASVGGQPDHSPPSDWDWKDENSGFARVVLYAFDYRAPSGSRCAQSVSVSLFPRKCSVFFIQEEQGEFQACPDPGFFFMDRKMKQRREKKSRNRETRPPWPDRGKYQSDWSRLSLVRSRHSALFPEVLMPLHTHHPGASGSEEHKRTETINRETRLTVAGPFVWYAAIR